jgi:transcription elongation factor Elf1
VFKSDWKIIRDGFKSISDKFEDIIKSLKNLNSNLDTLKDSLPVEFDCPVCKHVTLAKKALRFEDEVITPFNIHAIHVIENIYCYTCGNTFEKKDYAEWVKVEKEV